MRIVAVTALNQAFVDPVMVRLGEIRLGGDVASVAQLRLILNEQVLFLLRVVGGVTVETADLATGVRGFGEMILRVRFSVAGKTACARLLA